MVDNIALPDSPHRIISKRWILDTQSRWSKWTLCFHLKQEIFLKFLAAVFYAKNLAIAGKILLCLTRGLRGLQTPQPPPPVCTPMLPLLHMHRNCHNHYYHHHCYLKVYWRQTDRHWYFFCVSRCLLQTDSTTSLKLGASESDDGVMLLSWKQLIDMRAAAAAHHLVFT